MAKGQLWLRGSGVVALRRLSRCSLNGETKPGTVNVGGNGHLEGSEISRTLGAENASRGQ